MMFVLMIALMVVYVVCVVASFGGHYIHALPVLVAFMYVYTLFTGKSAGVVSE